MTKEPNSLGLSAPSVGERGNYVALTNPALIGAPSAIG
jgi:hypothetical protein